jgi:hypothetical protein
MPIGRTVTFRTVVLDPGVGIPESIIEESIGRARVIFGSEQVSLRESDRIREQRTESQRLLTRDALDAARAQGGTPQLQEERYRELRRWAALGGQEYILHVASESASDANRGLATPEAMAIIRQYWAPNQVLVVWAPQLVTPGGASGHTVCRPYYRNLPNYVEAVFMTTRGSTTTFAHEMGHVLMHCGHCESPGADPVNCSCARPGNLMFGDGDLRVPSPSLSPRQGEALRSSPYAR